MKMCSIGCIVTLIDIAEFVKENTYSMHNIIYKDDLPTSPIQIEEKVF